MRNGRDVPNHREIESNSLQSADSRFTSSAGTTHENFHFLQSMAHCLTGRILRDHLRCVGGALARALEADFAGARPANHVAVQVGDRDDRVVEGGKDMRDAGMNFLLPFALTIFGFSTSFGSSERFSFAGSTGTGLLFLPLPAFSRLSVLERDPQQPRSQERRCLVLSPRRLLWRPLGAFLVQASGLSPLAYRCWRILPVSLTLPFV